MVVVPVVGVDAAVAPLALTQHVVATGAACPLGFGWMAHLAVAAWAADYMVMVHVMGGLKGPLPQCVPIENTRPVQVSPVWRC